MHRWHSALVLTILVCASIGAKDEPKKPSDADIAKLLVGKWTTEEGKEGEPKVKSTFIYDKDGTFAVEATIETGGKTEKIVVSGTWKVADGVILDTVEKTNTENLKVGRVTRDTVISIDDKTLKYTTQKGRERTWKRVKD